MERKSRNFSIPIIDEPFNHEWTFSIYPEREQDYGNENGGKPFDSFIVTQPQCGTSSGYIRTMEEAEKEVADRIQKYVNDGNKTANLKYMKIYFNL